MRSPVLVTLIAALSLSAGAATAGAENEGGEGDNGAKALTEEQKIESLIATVRGLKDATFIRNGREHDCGEAADHMERKWKAVRRKVKSARDFIRLAASKSSRSGEAYRIRFSDGSEKTSEAFLTAALEKLEGKGKAAEKEGESEGRGDGKEETEGEKEGEAEIGEEEVGRKVGWKGSVAGEEPRYRGSR